MPPSVYPVQKVDFGLYVQLHSAPQDSNICIKSGKPLMFLWIMESLLLSLVVVLKSSQSLLDPHVPQELLSTKSGYSATLVYILFYFLVDLLLVQF